MALRNQTRLALFIIGLTLTLLPSLLLSAQQAPVAEFDPYSLRPDYTCLNQEDAQSVWSSPKFFSLLVDDHGKKISHVAYVQSTTIKNEEPEPTCRRVSRLMLYTDKDETPQTVFLLEPMVYQELSVLILVDWSSDGRFLVGQIEDLGDRTDAGWDQEILVYDAWMGVFRKPDYHWALEEFFGRKCNAFVQVRGFAKDMHLVLEVDDGLYGENACTFKSRYWQLYFGSPSRVEPLPNDFAITRNATVELKPSSPKPH